ncbi:site-specific DNA-methyltransferase [Phytoactinopolyspora mesophila]|uniref:site-specific DNA-methyltransferase (cytosine-N(4)-specific) n=1 Tax=Phytoactinopolyspora mesophila TaxID=2650750 RepID=A0A7K3MEX6_9ACTN|nr:site-specific DNA-methyltransferase [Phytoactinopolyspora mesophila]NDL60968.1 hypothetical protein [Phytoactinopolyspora mesophila]
MAPELALSSVSRADGEPILDPMCGSGMVLKAALQAGKQAIGFDLDPLAVLMSRVWTTAAPDDLEGCAASVIARANTISVPDLPWIDFDHETAEFVDFWFGKTQQHDLRKIAAVLWELDDSAEHNALRLALSRTIITKDRGASLASDVSHSRPHRTRTTNDYDVISGFKLAARNVGRILAVSSTSGAASVSLGDARDLKGLPDNSAGMIVTSPPYLNAIDYLRGHRLALVWLGYRVGDLRAVRSSSIGAERGLSEESIEAELRDIIRELSIDEYDRQLGRMLVRYFFDLDRMMAEASRVLKHGSDAVFVVGNSTIRSQFVDNATLTARAAERHGLRLVDRSERELPANRRYLPPPRINASDQLSRRMRTEVILRLSKSAA